MAIAYINEGYVHSDIDHVDWDYTSKVFNRKNSIKNNNMALLQRYKWSLGKAISNITDEDGNKINFITDMSDEDIQIMFEEMAKMMNEKVDKSIAQVISGTEFAARQASAVFANGFNEKQFAQIMESIEEALKKINSFNNEQWESFLTQYAYVMKNRSRKNHNLQASIKKLQGIVKQSEGTEMGDIMRILSNIPARMLNEDNKNYSAKQMVGTLNSIFDTVIGEQAIALTEDMIFDVDKEITAQFQKAKTTGKETVSSLTKPTRQVSGKVDVSKTASTELSLSLAKNASKKYTITGQFNSSVKWYGDKKTTPKHVSIQNISSYAQLANEIFKDDYAVYNTLAFVNDNHAQKSENFRIMRSSVISKYLDKFIAGTGQKTSGGTIDSAMFLVINGEFYPIFSILLAYLEDVKDKENKYGSASQGDLIYMNIYDVNNDWVGEPSVKNLALAEKRSNLAKASINKFKVNFSLNTSNPKFLSLVKKNNIKPI